jgi:hypothetical protein
MICEAFCYEVEKTHRLRAKGNQKAKQKDPHRIKAVLRGV